MIHRTEPSCNFSFPLIIAYTQPLRESFTRMRLHFTYRIDVIDDRIEPGVDKRSAGALGQIFDLGYLRLSSLKTNEPVFCRTIPRNIYL